MPTKTSVFIALGSVVLACTMLLAQGPAITISEVPPSDCGGPDKQANIAGKVTGIPAGQEDNLRIVIYAQACDNAFYVQPTLANPYVRVTQGSWDAHIFLGHTYWVMLVNKSYKPKGKTDTEPQVGGDVLAVTRVRGTGTQR